MSIKNGKLCYEFPSSFGSESVVQNNRLMERRRTDIELLAVRLHTVGVAVLVTLVTGSTFHQDSSLSWDCRHINTYVLFIPSLRSWWSVHLSLILVVLLITDGSMLWDVLSPFWELDYHEIKQYETPDGGKMERFNRRISQLPDFSTG